MIVRAEGYKARITGMVVAASLLNEFIWLGEIQSENAFGSVDCFVYAFGFAGVCFRRYTHIYGTAR